MHRKAVIVVLIIVAILLTGFFFLKPEKNNKEINAEETIDGEVLDIAEEIIFEESPLVVEVTEINDDYMVAYEYSSNQAFAGNVEELDLSSYINTHNEITYSFDGKEKIVSANDIDEIEVGDMLALYLDDDGMKTIVRY